MSIIESLWSGNVPPCEQCGSNDPEIEELIALIERNKEKLHRELTPLQHKIFDSFVDCTNEYTYLIAQQAFHDGFCLACKLLAEALTAC